METIQKLFCTRISGGNTFKILKAVLKPLIHFSNAFMIVQLNLSDKGVVSAKRFNILFILEFLLTLSATSYCGYSYITNNYFSIGNNVVDHTVWILTSLRILIPFTICVLSSFSVKPIVEYINVILETDTKLKLVDIKCANYEFVKRLGYFMYGFNTVKIFALFGTMVFRVWKEDPSLEICETCIGITLPIILMNAFTTSWIILLTLLQMQMAALNQSTRKMTKRKVWFINDINACTSKRKRVKDEVYLLGKFGQLYNIFIEQTERINRGFVMQLFVIVTASFPFILQQTYKMCKRLHQGSTKATVDVHLVLSNVISVVSLIELVVPCMAVKGEAEFFVECLHWNTWNIENNPNLEEMLNFVTLQTIHQKVEFSVFGLFPLDGTLLFSMLGAITTYLVILLQFDMG